ncbi:MAG: diguanylate cyclase [Pseudorhodoplanes sp.]|uniref:GGDEF domain-containing protein n=1 Tax=Pseudorhodoplanes sp. TaxID=1934341 RepID=UPI003D10030E
MRIDVPTLMLAGAFVASFCAALLLVAWYQYRETRAALWWAGADATLACAVALMAVGSAVQRDRLYLLGLTLLCVSAALTWAGARSFDGRRIQPGFLVAGSLLWIAVHAFALATITVSLVHTAIMVIYYAAAALSLQYRNGDAQRARLPLVVLLSVHAMTLMIAIPATLTMNFVPGEPPPVGSWFGVIHFEAIVFVVGTAIFLVAMMKERSERRHIEASRTDMLTGVLNRRGFLMNAERILDRCRHEAAPVAVIVFDIDRFKSINDRFGHAFGDEVLRLYSGVCRKMLRPGDAVGRMGGEEFAVILPGTGVEAAYAIAERFRKAFAQAAKFIEGHAVNVTVSGGVAADDGSRDILDLLADADAGLYRAKDRGRNRVEIGDSDQPQDTPNIARIA